MNLSLSIAFSNFELDPYPISHRLKSTMPQFKTHVPHPGHPAKTCALQKVREVYRLCICTLIYGKKNRLMWHTQCHEQLPGEDSRSSLPQAVHEAPDAATPQWLPSENQCQMATPPLPEMPMNSHRSKKNCTQE